MLGKCDNHYTIETYTLLYFWNIYGILTEAGLEKLHIYITCKNNRKLEVRHREKEKCMDIEGCRCRVNIR